MSKSIWQRWLRGLGLSFYAALLLGVAWEIPQTVGQSLEENQGIPEWVRVDLFCLWVAVMLVFCPLAFEWLTRRFGITMDEKDGDSSQAKLEGPHVTATPAGEGKKTCRGCGAVVNAYAIRCHQCKGVFVENGGADRS